MRIHSFWFVVAALLLLPTTAVADHGNTIEFTEFDAAITETGQLRVTFEISENDWAVLHDRGVAPTLVMYAEAEADGQTYFAHSLTVGRQAGSWTLPTQVRPFDAHSLFVELVGFDGAWRVTGLEIGNESGACVELERSGPELSPDDADPTDCTATARGQMPRNVAPDEHEQYADHHRDQDHHNDVDDHDHHHDHGQSHNHDDDHHDDRNHHDRHTDSRNHDHDDHSNDSPDDHTSRPNNPNDDEPTGAEKAEAINACNEHAGIRSVTDACLNAIQNMHPEWMTETVKACDEHTGTYSNQRKCLQLATDYDDFSPVPTIRACDDVTGTYSDNMKCINYGSDYEQNPAPVIHACDEVSTTYSDQRMCFRLGRQLPPDGAAELVKSCSDTRSLKSCLNAAQ